MKEQKMKKLMIAAAIVCVAVASQAATITWATDTTHLYVNPTTKTPEVMDKDTVGSMVLCILGTKADYSDATIVDTATFSTKSSKVGQTTKSTTWSYTDKQFGIDENTVFNIMFQDAKTDKLSKFVDATTGNELTLEYTVTGIDPAQEGTGELWSKTWTYSSGLSGNFTIATSVPEPTSGLLLLLGVAGLALRRRRA